MQNALKAPKGARAQQGIDKTARQTFAPGQMHAIRTNNTVRHDQTSAEVQQKNAPDQKFIAPEPTPHLTYEKRDAGLTAAADQFSNLSVNESSYNEGYSNEGYGNEGYGNEGYGQGYGN